MRGNHYQNALSLIKSGEIVFTSTVQKNMFQNMLRNNSKLSFPFFPAKVPSERPPSFFYGPPSFLKTWPPFFKTRRRFTWNTAAFKKNTVAFQKHTLQEENQQLQWAIKKRRSTLTSSLILLTSCLRTGKSHSCNDPVSVSAPWSTSRTSPT